MSELHHIGDPTDDDIERTYLTAFVARAFGDRTTYPLPPASAALPILRAAALGAFDAVPAGPAATMTLRDRADVLEMVDKLAGEVDQEEQGVSP
jgi:hypothetical protein